jgi:hypothetical protein
MNGCNPQLETRMLTAAAGREFLPVNACNVMRLGMSRIMRHPVNSGVRDLVSWFEHIAYGSHAFLRRYLPLLTSCLIGESLGDDVLKQFASNREQQPWCPA